MRTAGQGAVVRLTKKGARDRVLEGVAGMVFMVETFSQVPGGQLMAHVKDERFPDETLGRKYQVWSLGEGDYEVVVPSRKGSGCECCDHQLQHAIREFIDTYDCAVPPLKVSSVVDTLRERLTQWEDER